jgi:hypothetical protein
MILFLKTPIRTPFQARQFNKTIKMIIKMKFKLHMKTNINQTTNWSKISNLLSTVPSSSIKTKTTMSNQHTKKTKCSTKKTSLRNRTSQTKPSINNSILLTFNNNNNKMLISTTLNNKALIKTMTKIKFRWNPNHRLYNRVTVLLRCRAWAIKLCMNRYSLIN